MAQINFRSTAGLGDRKLDMIRTSRIASSKLLWHSFRRSRHETQELVIPVFVKPEGLFRSIALRQTFLTLDASSAKTVMINKTIEDMGCYNTVTVG